MVLNCLSSSHIRQRSLWNVDCEISSSAVKGKIVAGDHRVLSVDLNDGVFVRCDENESRARSNRNSVGADVAEGQELASAWIIGWLVEEKRASHVVP